MKINDWLISKNIDLRDRHTWILGLVGLALLTVTVIGFLWWQGQQSPLNSGDYEPFANQAEYDDFIDAHPPFTMQAPKEARFNYKTSVTYAKQPIYQIYLITPAVKPTTKLEDYQAYLRTLQQEAKDWFSGQGENLDDAYVQWFPDPDNLEPTPTPSGQQSLPPLGTSP